MDHAAGPKHLSRKKLGRLAAAIIVLLTANIATLLMRGAVLAQPLEPLEPLGMQSQQTWEH